MNLHTSKACFLRLIFFFGALFATELIWAMDNLKQIKDTNEQHNQQLSHSDLVTSGQSDNNPVDLLKRQFDQIYAVTDQKEQNEWYKRISESNDEEVLLSLAYEDHLQAMLLLSKIYANSGKEDQAFTWLDSARQVLKVNFLKEQSKEENRAIFDLYYRTGAFSAINNVAIQGNSKAWNKLSEWSRLLGQEGEHLGLLDEGQQEGYLQESQGYKDNAKNYEKNAEVLKEMQKTLKENPQLYAEQSQSVTTSVEQERKPSDKAILQSGESVEKEHHRKGFLIFVPAKKPTVDIAQLETQANQASSAPDIQVKEGISVLEKKDMSQKGMQPASKEHVQRIQIKTTKPKKPKKHKEKKPAFTIDEFQEDEEPPSNSVQISQEVGTSQVSVLPLLPKKNPKKKVMQKLQAERQKSVAIKKMQEQSNKQISKKRAVDDEQKKQKLEKLQKKIDGYLQNQGAEKNLCRCLQEYVTTKKLVDSQEPCDERDCFYLSSLGSAYLGLKPLVTGITQNHELAYKCLTKVIEHSKDQNKVAQANFDLALLYETPKKNKNVPWSRNLQKAEECFAKALAMGCADAQFPLAHARYRQEKFQEAYADFQKLSQEDPRGKVYRVLIRIKSDLDFPDEKTLTENISDIGKIVDIKDNLKPIGATLQSGDWEDLQILCESFVSDGKLEELSVLAKLFLDSDISECREDGITYLKHVAQRGHSEALDIVMNNSAIYEKLTSDECVNYLKMTRSDSNVSDEVKNLVNERVKDLGPLEPLIILAKKAEEVGKLDEFLKDIAQRKFDQKKFRDLSSQDYDAPAKPLLEILEQFEQFEQRLQQEHPDPAACWMYIRVGIAAALQKFNEKQPTDHHLENVRQGVACLNEYYKCMPSNLSITQHANDAIAWGRMGLAQRYRDNNHCVGICSVLHDVLMSNCSQDIQDDAKNMMADLAMKDRIPADKQELLKQTLNIDSSESLFDWGLQLLDKQAAGGNSNAQLSLAFHLSNKPDAKQEELEKAKELFQAYQIKRLDDGRCKAHLRAVENQLKVLKKKTRAYVRNERIGQATVLAEMGDIGEALKILNLGMRQGTVSEITLGLQLMMSNYSNVQNTTILEILKQIVPDLGCNPDACDNQQLKLFWLTFKGHLDKYKKSTELKDKASTLEEKINNLFEKQRETEKASEENIKKLFKKNVT